MIEILIDPVVVSTKFLITLQITWFGVFSLLGIAVAAFLVGRRGSSNHLDTDLMFQMIIWAIVCGLIGARLLHVADEWSDVYGKRPIEILFFWNGLAIWGGLIGGTLGAAAFARITGFPFATVADLAAPALLIGQTIGRIGNLINGEICAKATGLFWGTKWLHPESSAAQCPSGYQTPVHPVVAYEMLWDLFAFSIIWYLRYRLRPSGMLFAMYLALYAIGRFMIGFLREDIIWAMGLQGAQFISLAVLLITIPLLVWKAKFSSLPKLYFDLPKLPFKNKPKPRKRKHR